MKTTPKNVVIAAYLALQLMFETYDDFTDELQLVFSNDG